MQTERLLILISSGDGYHSPDIHALAGMVSDLLDILICAPEAARSGFSCAFSAVEYLRSKRGRDIGAARVRSYGDAPVNCVKLALDQLCPNRRPVLILGGVNHGDSSSVSNHYSSTMGIAMEDCMKYIPSVAFSGCCYEEDASLEPLRPYVRMVVKKMLTDGLPKGICLDVNSPARQVFEGIEVYRITIDRWVNEIVKQHHPRRYNYYWVVSEHQNDEPNAEDSDQWALNHGYVAITPAKMDVTAYEFMDEIREWEKPIAPSVFNAQG